MFAALSVLAATDANTWNTLLGLAAIVLFIVGVIKIIQREVWFGIALIVLAFLIGPGGISLLS